MNLQVVATATLPSAGLELRSEASILALTVFVHFNIK